MACALLLRGAMRPCGAATSVRRLERLSVGIGPIRDCAVFNPVGIWGNAQVYWFVIARPCDSLGRVAWVNGFAPERDKRKALLAGWFTHHPPLVRVRLLELREQIFDHESDLSFF